MAVPLPPKRRPSSSSITFILLLIALAGVCLVFVHFEGTHFQGALRTNLGLAITSDAPRHVANTNDYVLDQPYNVCIVGAGLSGAVIAERYASVLQQSVLILEKRNHIGGNCYDYMDEETGIRVSKFGAHLFHTTSRRVWDYVHRFAHWTKYEHTVLGFVENKHVPIPVNIDTVNALFQLNISSEDEMKKWLENEQTKYSHEPRNSEEMAKSRVGPRLYDLIFKPYTFKQWAKYPAELGPEVTARIPVRTNHDGRYFGDPYQALPTRGYTRLFENLLDSKYITVKVNTDYFQVKDKLKCGRLYYTGPIDAYFSHLGWPKLEYRSLDFERVVQKNVDYFQPVSVVNHPSPENNFTRIVEYKHLLNQSSPHTIYFIERSKDGGEPYYPVPNDENKELYQKYQKMAEKENNVTFVGRLANYKYFNMDQAILNALELFDQESGVPEEQQWTDLLAKE
jgi:UDP-galactopyranose mutase